jgi:hypothetical protein
MRHRLLLLATLPLICAASLLVTAVCDVQYAHAACNGTGSPVFISRFDNSGSYVIGQEGPVYPGTTCDGNYVYQGAVLDAYNDGSCITAYYLEPLSYYAAQGVSCTTGSWSFYSYVDSIGPNSVYVNVVATYSTPDQWYLSHGY